MTGPMIISMDLGDYRVVRLISLQELTQAHDPTILVAEQSRLAFADLRQKTLPIAQER